jgi:ABC-2 type transport system ATP-binding protein
MIQAINLTKRYEDGLLALDTLNFEIKAGEVYCLLGANGAGKTTAINLFLNFIEPTSGQALINGIDCARAPLEAKRYVSFVSENVMLYGNFTARQNLDFFARLAGRRNMSREDYYMAMRKVVLPEKAFEQRVKEFSKGMRQKLGIAIALVKDASAILLDEPTSGLDPKAAAEFMILLGALKTQGKAILMSTHDIFRTKEIADRVGILKEGRLVIERTRRELMQEDLERLYLDYMQAGFQTPLGAR